MCQFSKKILSVYCIFHHFITVEKLNFTILGVIKNRCYLIYPNYNKKHYIFGEGGAKKISEEFKISVLGEISLNSGIMSGSDLGKLIIITNPDSPSANTFRTCAKNITAH